MNYIRRDYNRKVGEILTDFETIEKRTKLSKEDLVEIYCKNCNKPAKKGNITKVRCDTCGLEAERKNVKNTNRKLRCLNNDCAGNLEIIDEKDYYYYCENCKDFDNKNLQLDSKKYPEMFEEVKGVSAEKIASLDLVLVAPRHLFRMPYSLHEKTALASVVLEKEKIKEFTPKDADPMKVEIKNYMPENEENEAENLLKAALEWKANMQSDEEKVVGARSRNYEEIKLGSVTEDMFPKPIKKLLMGLEEGRKRGLFILLTFLRSLNFPPEYIEGRVREWNKKNKQPLKEGYVKSQIDWILKQKKKILPPNYDNEAFYKDLGLLDGKPEVKNPIVEVTRKIKGRNDRD